MDYALIEPITKPNGEKIETVSVKEKFNGCDVKAIGNAACRPRNGSNRSCCLEHGFPRY